MAYRIILRRDSSVNWEASNPVLLLGEPGYETDTGYFKIGDGVSTWTQLAFYTGATGSPGATGSVGPTGSLGPTGATGPLPVGYAVTGSNQFYGDQSITGSISILNGILLNPQTFSGLASVPDGYNGSLNGPINLTGQITVEGSGILSIT